MGNYEKEIMNRVYWTTGINDKRIYMGNLKSWFRRKHNRNNDSYFDEKIKNLIDDGYLKYLKTTKLNFVTTSITEDDGTTINIPKEKQKSESFDIPQYLVLTDKGIEYIEGNKKFVIKTIRNFAARTGITILLAHLLVLMLLMP